MSPGSDSLYSLLQAPRKDEGTMNIQSLPNMNLPDNHETDISTISESTSSLIIDHGESYSASAIQRSRLSYDRVSQLRQKILHNAVERKYRNNMDANISCFNPENTERLSQMVRLL